MLELVFGFHLKKLNSPKFSGGGYSSSYGGGYGKGGYGGGYGGSYGKGKEFLI